MLRENNMKDIWIDLSKGAYIYVCGATQMGADVTLAFISIMMKNGLFNRLFVIRLHFTSCYRIE